MLVDYARVVRQAGRRDGRSRIGAADRRGWLNADMTWFSGAAQREVTAPTGCSSRIFFNHQTHHRGQAHALITGRRREDRRHDLFLVIPQMVV